MAEDRNGKGRFTQEHTDGEVLAAVRAHEPAATSEVADELDVSRQAADYRLRRLRDDGRVNSKKIGASLVWFGPPEDDQERTTSTEQGAHAPERRRERAETAVDDGKGETAAEGPRADEGQATARDSPASDPDADTIDEILDGWRPGRSLKKREQQRPAGRAALEYLRGREEAQASEFKQDVEPEHSVEGQSPDTWWKNTARPALKRAQERDVAEFQDGEKLWRWVGK
jgi:DNA-binding Lrp family transcriptional regulator